MRALHSRKGCRALPYWAKLVCAEFTNGRGSKIALVQSTTTVSKAMLHVGARVEDSSRCKCLLKRSTSALLGLSTSTARRTETDYTFSGTKNKDFCSHVFARQIQVRVRRRITETRRTISSTSQ